MTVPIHAPLIRKRKAMSPDTCFVSTPRVDIVPLLSCPFQYHGFPALHGRLVPIVFGKHFLPALQRFGQTGLATRIESLFERAAKEYADVKFRSGTIGETAKSELYDIRHLGVGKVAPEIAGKDQDGKQFKLSDYRGNVVLLYFWSEF